MHTQNAKPDYITAPDPTTVAEVLDPSTSEVMDRCYNWETAQTYASNGYKIRALAADGEAWPIERIQAMCDAERRQFQDCYDRVLPFDY